MNPCARTIMPVVLLALVSASNAMAAPTKKPSDAAEARATPVNQPTVLEFTQPTRSLDTGVDDAEVIITRDGRTALIFRQDETLDLGLVLADWSAWIITALLSLWLLWRWWRLGRLARRQPAKGEPYCHKCAYQLTGTTTDTCPECGRNVTGRGRKVSKGGRVLLFRAVVTMMIAGTAIGAAHLYREPLRRTVNRLVFWPAHSLYEWVEKEEFEWRYEYREGVTHVEAFNLQTGESRWQRTIQLSHTGRGCLSSDGQWVFVDGAIDSDEASGILRIRISDGDVELLLTTHGKDYGLAVWAPAPKDGRMLIAQRTSMSFNDDVVKLFYYDPDTGHRQWLEHFKGSKAEQNARSIFGLDDSTAYYFGDACLLTTGEGLYQFDYDNDRERHELGAFEAVKLYGLSADGTVVYADLPLGDERNDFSRETVYPIGIYGGQSRDPISRKLLFPRKRKGTRVFLEGGDAPSAIADDGMGWEFIGHVITDTTGRFAFFFSSPEFIEAHRPTDGMVTVWDHDRNRVVARFDLGFGYLLAFGETIDLAKAPVLNVAIQQWTKGPPVPGEPPLFGGPDADPQPTWTEGNIIIHTFDLRKLLDDKAVR